MLCTLWDPRERCWVLPALSCQGELVLRPCRINPLLNSSIPWNRLPCGQKAPLCFVAGITLDTLSRVIVWEMLHTDPSWAISAGTPLQRLPLSQERGTGQRSWRNKMNLWVPVYKPPLCSGTQPCLVGLGVCQTSGLWVQHAAVSDDGYSTLLPVLQSQHTTQCKSISLLQSFAIHIQNGSKRWRQTPSAGGSWGEASRPYLDQAKGCDLQSQAVFPAN